MPRIFVTQDSGQFDFSSLATWGVVVATMTKAQTFPDVAQEKADQLLNQFVEIFDREEFDGDEDYIALVGDPLMVAMVTAVALRYASNKLRFLKFDRRENGYYLVELNIGVLNALEDIPRIP